jgi:quercetin dioxygenase-like cupin family protein
MPTNRSPIVLPPSGGRSWPMGRIQAIFKADGEQTAGTFSVSEWWLDPYTEGPPAHQHEDDHAWYVLAGTMAVQLGERWLDAPQGSFLHIPGGTRHTFENRTGERAGILSFNNRAGFEAQMPGISAWFAANPAGDVSDRRPPD